MIVLGKIAVKEKGSLKALLLDLNNIYVSSVNQKFEPLQFLRAIPETSIKQIHLAGHSQVGGCLIDTHDGPVVHAVWELYREAIKLYGMKPTLIEWDAEIPEFAALEAEAHRAEAIRRENYAKN